MAVLSPPRPAALRHLLATDAEGLRFFAANSVLTIAGVWLSLTGTVAAWAFGQILLGLAMVEWFVLLHECGHNTLFRQRRLNVAAGHIAGFFSLIPFSVWTHVHHLHHKWTGWQDLDPTTATLVPRRRGRFERGLGRRIRGRHIHTVGRQRPGRSGQHYDHRGRRLGNVHHIAADWRDGGFAVGGR